MSAADHHPDQERIVVATFPNRVVAEMAAGYLEGEDIEAWVAADDAGGAYPVLQSLEGVRLLVAAEDEERAREILEALQASAGEPEDADTEAGAGEDDAGATVLPFPRKETP
jgi:hypothetical protein